MSEKAPAPRGPEHKTSIEAHGERAPSAERPREHEKAKTPEKHHNVEAIQKSIENQARSSKETPVGEQEAEARPVIGQQHELKAEAYQKMLRNARARMRPSEQTFSKVIHQPIVESVSTITAATAGRSSGLVGGGLVALLGSSFILFMGEYYGFRYNFFVFIATFIGGFVLGVVIEFLWRLAKGKRRSSAN